MPTEVLPTAEGDLGRTPFAHLLVYVLDKQLTGALVLREPSGAEHRVRLEAGAPVKVHPGDGYARLGELLVDAGVIDAPTLEGALSMHGLLGDALLLAGCVERDTLERTAERQFMLRMTRLFALPPETTYQYFNGLTELVDDAAPPACTHPLAVLWTGIREHADRSTRMDATLERLGSTVIRVHASATVGRFGATPEELSLLERIRRHPQPLASLLEGSIGKAETLRWMVYALVITRNLDLGSDTRPLCADPELSKAMSAQAGAVALARIRLRSASHRVGSAAPDAGGDGDRVRAQPRPRRRGKPSSFTLAARRITTPPPMERVIAPPKDGTEPPTSAVKAVDPAPPHVPAPTPPDASLLADADGMPPGVPIAPEGQPDAALPAHALYRLATARLAERDLSGALQACQLAREIDPTQADYAALAVWIRSLLGGADLAARVGELDALLDACADHVQALFYRGFLRRRIGDEPGAERDLRRALEIDPTHRDAARELKRLELGQPATRPSGLYKQRS
ncbi:tetratricopeptide repeat protein [Polyangium aurulentum]|uniref:tetratricopeptide repeat protein n=1 Tax=Polyangium aurulentum TaxID=2567896 RepID=UPI0010AE92B1|nr:hypothetical protein [Polyangium aurulentum]UQA62140.1 hypothetical protein E8A73_017380 [Polyangium aurulentum]